MQQTDIHDKVTQNDSIVHYDGFLSRQAFYEMEPPLNLPFG